MMFRRGDRVLVMGTVKFDQVPGDMLVHVDLDGDATSRPILHADDLKLVSCKFKVDDRIRLKDGSGDLGAVLAVREYADGSAVLFVELESGAIITAHGDGVELVDDLPPTYTVKAGEVLSRIADQLGVSVDALARRNGIDDPDRIEAGHVLVIPPSPAVPRYDNPDGPGAA